MRRTLMTTTLLALLLAATSALAQAPTPAKANTAQSGKQGALLFSLAGITAAPGLYDNVGAGARWALSDKMMLRAGVGLFSQSTETETTFSGNTNKAESSAKLFGLEGGVELPLYQRKDLTIYVGGIAQLGWGSAEPDDNTESTTTQLTLAGIAGATWFFADSVSLGAEYRLGLARTSEETKQGSGDSKSTTENTTSNFGVGQVGFLLGFWF